MRHLQGVQGVYKTPTRGMRCVHDTYKEYKAGMKPLQEVCGRYKIPIMGTRLV